MLKVNSIFCSLQGEGMRVGQPEIFIRLAGCNQHCKWCDTQYASKGTDWSEEKILEEIAKYAPIQSVCITGGEPLIQSIRPLVRMLKNKEYFVSIQTNGSIVDKQVFTMVDLISMDFKTPSSGVVSTIEPISFACQFDSAQIKFVIQTEEDFKFMVENVKKLRHTCDLIKNIILIQPCGYPATGLSPTILAEKILNEKALLDINIRLSLQIHKILWDPNEQNR